MKADIRQLVGRYLAIRPRSEAEVLRYLSGKKIAYGLTDAYIAELISRYKDMGIINDDLFVEAVVHASLSKGKGARFIQQKLKLAGIDEVTAGAGVSSTSPEDVQAAMEKR